MGAQCTRVVAYHTQLGVAEAMHHEDRGRIPPDRLKQKDERVSREQVESSGFDSFHRCSAEVGPACPLSDTPNHPG